MPEIAVVAATHNRARRLEALLDGLRAQTIGTERFEVIVVDDGSGDDTPAVLAAAEQAGDLQLTGIRRDVPAGPATARNAGWRAATAPVVAFTDDDCVPTPTWLEALLEAGVTRDRVVQGRTEPIEAERDRLGPFARTMQVSGPSPYYETCNIAYDRGLLAELDGFDESFPAPAGEDADLGYRAQRAGAIVVFEPRALVHHAVDVVGPGRVLREAARVTDALPMFEVNPEMRQLLVNGIFYRSSHPLLLQAAAALAMSRRFAPAAIFALPYALHLRGRTKLVHGGPQHAPFLALWDAVELGCTLRGALRHRVRVL